jgi:hypothetical protein
MQAGSTEEEFAADWRRWTLIRKDKIRNLFEAKYCAVKGATSSRVF